MSTYKEYTTANSKRELLYRVRFDLEKSFGIEVPLELVSRVIRDRAGTIRTGMENKIPRMIIQGVGSFTIKKGRENALKKAGKIKDTGNIFGFKYKSVSNDAEVF